MLNCPRSKDSVQYFTIFWSLCNNIVVSSHLGQMQLSNPSWGPQVKKGASHTLRMTCPMIMLWLGWVMLESVVVVKLIKSILQMLLLLDNKRLGEFALNLVKKTIFLVRIYGKMIFKVICLQDNSVGAMLTCWTQIWSYRELGECSGLGPWNYVNQQPKSNEQTLWAMYKNLEQVTSLFLSCLNYGNLNACSCFSLKPLDAVHHFLWFLTGDGFKARCCFESRVTVIGSQKIAALYSAPRPTT